MKQIMILLRETLGFDGTNSNSVSMSSIVDENCQRYSDVVRTLSILDDDPFIAPKSQDALGDLGSIPLPTDDEASEDMTQCYAVWLNGDVERLIASWDSLKLDPYSKIKARHFFLTSHNLKGTAAGFGKPTIARLCRSLCLLLKREQVSEDLALINLHVDACKAAMMQRRGAPEIANAVCMALELQVARSAA